MNSRLTPVRSICKYYLLFPMKAFVKILSIVNVSTTGMETMSNSTSCISSHMHLHPKIPLISFFRLFHIRVSFFLLVFSRAGSCYQGSIYRTSILNIESLREKKVIYLLKNSFTYIIFFKTMTKVLYCCRIRNSLGSYIYIKKFLKGYLIPYLIFYCLICKVIVFLKKVYFEHQERFLLLSSNFLVIPIFIHFF